VLQPVHRSNMEAQGQEFPAGESCWMFKRLNKMSFGTALWQMVATSLSGSPIFGSASDPKSFAPVVSAAPEAPSSTSNQVVEKRLGLPTKRWSASMRLCASGKRYLLHYRNAVTLPGSGALHLHVANHNRPLIKRRAACCGLLFVCVPARHVGPRLLVTLARGLAAGEGSIGHYLRRLSSSSVIVGSEVGHVGGWQAGLSHSTAGVAWAEYLFVQARFAGVHRI